MNPDHRSAAQGPNQSSGLHRRLAINSVSNVGKNFIFLVAAFFLTPFVIRTLGDSAYGFWVVLLSFLGYAGILELGIQPAIVKLVGQHRGTGDFQKLADLLASALCFFVVMGSLIALAIALLGPTLATAFVRGLEGDQYPRLFYHIVAVDSVVMFVSFFYAGVLFGAQLYHTKNVIDVVGLLAYAATLFLMLEAGGLILLAGAKLATDAVVLVATMCAAHFWVPEARINIRRVTSQSLRELASFGGRLFIVSITTRATTHTLPLIVSSQLGATWTTFYAIPVRLVDYSRQITWALTMGFMPMFSELGGRNDHDMIRVLYLRYSRYLLTLSLPILTLMLVHGRDFIGLWIGPSYADRGGWTLYLLLATALARSFQPLLWRLFIGLGKLDFIVFVSAIGSAVTILLALALVNRFGIEGVAAGGLVSAAVTQAIFLWYAGRHFQLSPARLLLEVHSAPVLACFALYVLSMGLDSLIGNQSYGTMLASVILASLLYLPIALLSLRPFERSAVRQRLRILLTNSA